MSDKGKSANQIAAENPWGMTAMECVVFDAMVRLGCGKRVAKALRLSIKTVENHCWNGGQKMGDNTRLIRYIKWDRFRRGSAG